MTLEEGGEEKVEEETHYVTPGAPQYFNADCY